MLHHNMSPRCVCGHCLLCTSTSLLELRDALLGLSLALQDWQFETEHALRQETEEKVRQLLSAIASKHGLDSH